MICFPNAKINIGLNIVERRPDNFHNIETLFYPIPLTDILEIIISEEEIEGKVELKITGNQINCNKEVNLCFKAYQILDKEFHFPSVKIYLHKIIPIGSGLGGGSSDGAYTLTLLNKIFNLGLGSDELTGFASQLGSDCSFFINNNPSVGLEKGDKLIASNINLKGCYLVIVKPDIFVSTAEAYTGIIPNKSTIPLKDILKLPINTWKEKIFNAFELPIFKSHPDIKSVKDFLYDNGSIYSSMTGSGSAVYGIFENEVQFKDNFPGMFYWSSWL